jgi:hypothetical protein
LTWTPDTGADRVAQFADRLSSAARPGMRSSVRRVNGLRFIHATTSGCFMSSEVAMDPAPRRRNSVRDHRTARPARRLRLPMAAPQAGRAAIARAAIGAMAGRQAHGAFRNIAGRDYPIAVPGVRARRLRPDAPAGP